MFNTTPLMLAASAGNEALVRELLAWGANAELTDNYGRTAWQHALTRAVHQKHYAVGLFQGVHELLAPGSISLKAEDRLIKIDASQGEFLLFQLFFSLLHDRLNSSLIDQVALTAVKLADMIVSLPDSISPAYRKKRQYLSSLLSKNEIDGTNPYGRKLFVRLRTGYYLLNPKLSVLYKDEWIPLYRFAGIELLAKSATVVDAYFKDIITVLYAWENGLGGARPVEPQ
jgi:Ankyrin repeats (many copies)